MLVYRTEMNWMLIYETFSLSSSLCCARFCWCCLLPPPLLFGSQFTIFSLLLSAFYISHSVNDFYGGDDFIMLYRYTYVCPFRSHKTPAHTILYIFLFVHIHHTSMHAISTDIIRICKEWIQLYLNKMKKKI